jgi:hypothetical protein
MTSIGCNNGLLVLALYNWVRVKLPAREVRFHYWVPVFAGMTEEKLVIGYLFSLENAPAFPVFPQSRAVAPE